MLDGAMVALATPLANDRVDDRALRRLVRWHEEAGTDVLVPCGTTGESATLSYEEHEHVIEVVSDEASVAPVVAGTGSNSTHEAVRLTRFARDAGCRAALVITPYYNLPTQDGMRKHFEKIANTVEFDLVLYNVPSRTGVNLEAETVGRLAEHEHIVGIKEASGDLAQVAEICRRTSDDFAVLSGNDAATLPLLSVGGCGVISVVGNVVPERVRKLITTWSKGNPMEAQTVHEELLPLIRAMFWEPNPIPVKTALSMMGLCEEELRLPLTPLSPELREPLASELKKAGVRVDA